jgi:hypothetical protein
LLALGGLGAVRSVRPAPSLIATLLLYLLAVTLWPYVPDRFIWLVLPWILVVVAVGGADLARRGRGPAVAVAVLALLATAGYMRREAISLGTRGFAAESTGISRSFRLLAPSIAAETPDDAVIASSDEALIYLYTGRRAVPNYVFRWDGRDPTPLSDSRIRDYFCNMGVTHVVLTGPAANAAEVVARLARRDDVTLRSLFAFTDGPSLSRFECLD